MSKVIAMGIGAVLVLVILVFLILLVFSGSFAREEAPATEPPPTLQPVETIPTDAPVDNPVPETNPYRDCYTPEEFILPQSQLRYYAPAELQDLSDMALQVAKAEIAARHGATPNDKDLYDYFSCLSWYAPGEEPEEYNTYENQNLFLLDVCLRQRDGSIYRTANPYMIDFDDGYFLPHSASRYLDGSDLQHLSERELVLARNEIFARYGYIFSDAVLGEYFCCQSWYKPATLAADFDAAVFSDQEQANLGLIALYEQIREGITPAADNPYMPYFDPDSPYIFFNSDGRILNDSDVSGLSVPELVLARNEIFARHGYSFTDAHLMQYFLQCHWYQPQVAPGRLDLISLGGTERENVDFLLKHQDIREDMEALEDLDTSLTYGVACDMFRLSLPSYWRDYALCNFYDSASIRFSEKLSHESMDAGHLFTVRAYTDDSFYELPSFSILRQVADAYGNQYYLVVIYPTDVQCDAPYADLYFKMYGEIERILVTLTLKEGYTVLS